MDFARQNRLIFLPLPKNISFVPEAVLTTQPRLSALQSIRWQPPSLGQQRDIGGNLESNLADQPIATSRCPFAARTIP